jgi:hypothetical protein
MKIHTLPKKYQLLDTKYAYTLYADNKADACTMIKYEIIARIWFPYFVPGRWDPINRFNPSTFLAHLAKGNVSFCHHLASVVR